MFEIHDEAVPSSIRIWQEGIGKYLEWCAKRQISEIARKDYELSLWRSYRLLSNAGLSTGFLTIGESDILGLKALINGATDYKKAELSMLGAFLRFQGNNIYEKMALRWPPPARPNVKWHSIQEQELLWSEAEGRELAILHFGLETCMRRCELGRLRFENFSDGQIQIMGKGMKTRSIPQHPGTPTILKMLGELYGNQTGFVFQDINEYHMVKEDKPLHKNTLDSILGCGKDNGHHKPGLGQRAGVRTSFHTLRRSGARNLWECGVKIETIAQLLGHSDTRTTMKYIGVQIADIADAYQLALNRGKVSCVIPTIKS